MDERSIIERILGGVSVGEPLRVPPGDDAAVVHLAGRDLVVSSDMSVEGVHFRLDWISPREAGRRAVSAALSDLAAMAAEPVAVMLSIGAEDGEVLAEAGVGARERAAEFEIPVAGGDVTRGSALTLDVTVLGAVEGDAGAGRPPWRRGGAHPGDEVWLTGRLGAPAAAVERWLARESVPEALRRRFTDPTPRLHEARLLADRASVHAAIDLSDGLFRDAHRVADASGVAVELDAAAIPIWPSLGGDVERVGAWGEEYELLLFAPSIPAEAIEALGALDCLLTRIGRVGAGSGVHLDGRPVKADGFDHFGAGPVT